MFPLRKTQFFPSLFLPAKKYILFFFPLSYPSSVQDFASGFPGSRGFLKGVCENSLRKKEVKLAVMELVGPTRGKDQNKIKHSHGGMRMGLDSENLLVIKLPDLKLLRIISRSVFLALVFITFPCIGSFIRGAIGVESNAKSGIFHHEQLDLLLHNLSEERLFRKSDKALVVSSGAKSVIHSLKNFGAEQTVMVMDSPLEGQSSLVFDESFDFVFASNFAMDVEFVDRVLRTGGIVAFPLSGIGEQANILRDKANYKIVYLRHYSSTIVAMRKITPRAVDEASAASSFAKRRLLQSETDTSKSEVLKDLEEVLLEPPRKRPRQLSRDLKNYSRKIKFLPQLLGDDSLEGFRRRVFVNVGLPEQSKDVIEWFHRNYPKMKQEFEVFDLNVVPEEGTSRLASTQNGISDWLTKNVSKEEYVVMKAEAEAVEEMINKRTIDLVDELFLECSNQWWKVGKKKGGSKRAYWECLALYGRVKDEGVAVHQWWG